MRYFIIIFCLLLFNCGAKKKIVERGKETVSIIESEGLKKLTTSTKIKTAEIRKWHVSTFNKKGFRATLIPDDPRKPMTYSDSKGNSYTFTGAKKVVLEDYELEAVQVDSVKIVSDEKNDNSESLEQNKRKETFTKKSWRNASSFIMRVPIWLWLIVLLALLYYLYRRLR